MQEGGGGVYVGGARLRPRVSAICLHKWRSKLWPASLIIYTKTVATPTMFTQNLAKIGSKRGF